MQDTTLHLSDDEELDGELEVCPHCGGAAYFRSINLETQVVTTTTCIVCKGERLIKRQIPELLQ